MKKRVSHIIALLAILALVSCSTKKNTAFTRFYHSFTTRYNVYFNGIENYKEQIKTMENEYEDNFTDLIYMHPAQAYANPKDPQPTGSFDRTIEKCQKAIQLHSIKKKPRRNSKKMSDPKYRDYLKRDEFNPYIHNAWRLMGQAQYYKGEFLEAAATFLYISRHFTWMPDLVAESKLWQARCYIALGWLYEAEDILQKINNDKLPESQNNWFATVNADYLIHKGEYQKAIPFLETAIKSAPSKRQRIRLTFLLGQLYEKTQDPARAYQTFGQVISMNPPYRTEFNARIKQTEVFSGKNIDKEVKKLTRMASRDRNKEYLDQIYYAIGNLYLSRKDTLKAMENYRLANQKSTRNGIEKAICQVTLGDLYFDRREYVDAQPCYAEALPQLKEDFPRYDLLSRRSTVLDELVVYAQNVELQDSLQNLAAMSEEERNKAIQKIIDDLIKKEKEEAENLKREEYLAQQQGPQFNSSNAAKNNATMISGDKSWYFYNKTMVSAGKTEFQRIWGSRKLEDDWRRRNKSGFSMSDFAEKTAGGGGEEGGTEFDENGMPVEEIPDSAETAAADDPHKPEFYLKQIPMTPEALKTSNEVVAEGLFNMGLILKNKLEDYPAAIANFNLLEERFPENPYRLDVYYNMYLMYMRDGDEATAGIYRDKIRSTFPESPYAQAMADPHYLDNLRRMSTEQDSIYEATYAAYLENDNRTVHDNRAFMEQKYPLSPLMPKFLFLDALAHVGDKQYDQFKEGLRNLLERYPQADVSPLASTMLKGVAQGRQVAQGGGNLRGMIWKARLTNDTTTVFNDSVRATFTQDLNAPHVLLLVYATDSVSSNQLLFDVAKHNFTNFVVKDFDLEIMTFNEISMLVVKGFSNFEELSHYRRLLDNSETFRYPPGVKPIMISEDNFKKLLEGYSFEDYFLFLENNPQPTEPYEER